MIRRIVALLLLLLPALPCWANYTLTITATNGVVHQEPEAEDYAPDAVVRIVAQPAQGYRFVNWSGDVPAGQRADDGKLDVTMTANKAITANFAVWAPPIGVPEPSFGIFDTYRGYDDGGAVGVDGRTYTYTRNPALVYRPSDLGGVYTHYIDNTAEGATDSGNTYGTKPGGGGVPRATVPKGTIPAGSIIEIHGGPYVMTERTLNGDGSGDGTQRSPIFIRGASFTSMPQINVNIRLGYDTSKDAKYFVLENLHVHPTDTLVTGISISTYAEGHHNVIRQCISEGNANQHGNRHGFGIGNGSTNYDLAGNITGGALSTATSHDHVLYGCYAHTWHDWTDDTDDWDNQGCSVSSGNAYTGSGIKRPDQDKYTYNIWLVDNAFQHCTGDGIQVNCNLAQPEQHRMHHIYVGRNHAWENHQPAFWTKYGVDIIFTQNHAWGAGQSSTSAGGCMGAQYGASRVWFLYNICHSDKFGIRYATDDQWGIYPEYCALDNYLIGNVVYDIHRRPGYPDGADVWQEGGAFMCQQETTKRSYFLNSVYDCDAAFVLARRGAIIAENNLFAGIADNFYVCGFPDQLGDTYILNNIVDAEADVYWGNSTAHAIADMEALAAGHWTNTIIDDPEYVDADNGDFTLAATSPAVDSAVLATRAQAALDLFQTTYGININVDANGKLRDASPDKGAYEYDPELPPGAPTTPTPADDAEDVASNTTLRWGAGAYAAYYRVYLDTVNPPVTALSTHCTTNAIASGLLEAGREYFWKVVSVNGTGELSGPVWSYTTGTPLSVPGVIGSPSPANGATGVSTTPTLSWTIATDAESYDVWINTENSFDATNLISDNQIGLSCPAGTLAKNTRYYWKVVAANPAGNGNAVVSSFTTENMPDVRYTLIRGELP